MSVEGSRFREAVARAFGPVCEELGLVGPGPDKNPHGYSCSYERKGLLLVVSDYPSQCELDVKVEWPCAPGSTRRPSYDLSEIAWALLGRTDVIVSYMACSGEPARYLAGVEYLAKVTREVLPSVLADPWGALDRVRLATDSRRAEASTKWKNDGLRRNAEDAWKRKQFRRVVTLYESIVGQLSALEQGRLEYARRHAGWFS